MHLRNVLYDDLYCCSTCYSPQRETNSTWECLKPCIGSRPSLSHHHKGITKLWSPTSTRKDSSVCVPLKKEQFSILKFLHRKKKKKEEGDCYLPAKLRAYWFRAFPVEDANGAEGHMMPTLVLQGLLHHHQPAVMGPGHTRPWPHHSRAGVISRSAATWAA